MRRLPPSRRDLHAHALHPPGKRLLRAIRLRFVGRAMDVGRRGVSARLNLVSLVDFMVVTVLYLLLSFSASGE